MRVPLTKMHGALNDFVILDQRTIRLRNLPAFSRWLCDRRGGIGADGLIVIESSHRANVRMRTINADGSEAEMCGNGIRCAARWLDESSEQASISFETNAGIVRTEILSRLPEYLVRVGMGRAQVTPITVAGLDATLVDVGNRHVVFFVERLADSDFDRCVATVLKDPEFPEDANIHLAQREDEHTIRALHWERGVGSTMACGTGAVACAAVAIAERIASPPIAVLVPGGKLIVEWNDQDTYLTGPAVRVFDTDVDVDSETFA